MHRLFRWLRQPPVKIKATVARLQNPAVIDSIKSDMLNGAAFKYAEPRGIIAGILVNGTYYVMEGHHRMTAAFEVYLETGDDAAIRELISHGLWPQA